MIAENKVPSACTAAAKGEPPPRAAAAAACAVYPHVSFAFSTRACRLAAELCHGVQRAVAIPVNTQDATLPVPPWAKQLNAHLPTLLKAYHSIPSQAWKPYCHHANHCGNNAAWNTFHLMVIRTRAEPHLHMMGAQVQAILNQMLDTIPGLLNVAFSRTSGSSHIRPHCGAAEGHVFQRYHLAVDVPEPPAQIRICEHTINFKAGHLFSFNNSIPHEVLNKAPVSRAVLLFDVLVPALVAASRARSSSLSVALDYLFHEWKDTLAIVDRENEDFKGRLKNIPFGRKQGERYKLEDVSSNSAHEREYA